MRIIGRHLIKITATLRGCCLQDGRKEKAGKAVCTLMLALPMCGTKPSRENDLPNVVTSDAKQ